MNMMQKLAYTCGKFIGLILLCVILAQSGHASPPDDGTTVVYSTGCWSNSGDAQDFFSWWNTGHYLPTGPSDPTAFFEIEGVEYPYWLNYTLTWKNVHTGDRFRVPADGPGSTFVCNIAALEKCPCQKSKLLTHAGQWFDTYSNCGDYYVYIADDSSPNSESPGASNSSIGSARITFSLGNKANGNSAGSIELHEQALSAASYTPFNLLAGGYEGVVTLYTDDTSLGSAASSSGNYLRQVLSGDVLADVIAQDSTKYFIKFYRNSSTPRTIDQTTGCYTVTGETPFVVYTIENPDPAQATPSKIQLTESRPGQSDRVSLFTLDQNGSSILLTDGGNTKESKIPGTVPDGNATLDHTLQVKVGAGWQIVSRTLDTYHTFSWGQELVSKVVDPGGAALTTIYTYYAVAPPYTGAYGKLQSITNPDGSWERYTYLGGNISQTFSSWKDVELSISNLSDCHVTSINGNETDETILGQPVSKTITDTTSSTGTTTSTVFASATDALTTTTIKNSDGTVSEVDSPDGTIERHTYTTIAFQGANAKRELILHGTATYASGVPNVSTADVRVTDNAGHLASEQTYVCDGSTDPSVTPGNLLAQTTHTFDTNGYPFQDIALGGRVLHEEHWESGVKQWEKDEQGIETDYAYDERQRVHTSTKKGVTGTGGYAAQPDIVTTYGYDALGRETSVTVSAGGLTRVSTTEYDVAGRVKSQTQGGLTTTTAYANGGRTVTVTYPNHATQVTDHYLDGRVKSVTGTAQVAAAYDYQVYSSGFRQALVTTGPADSTRTVTTTNDWIGRTVEVDAPAFGEGTAVTAYTYNPQGVNGAGQVSKVSRTGMADTLYIYDTLGNQTLSGVDMDGDGTLTTGNSSIDRVTGTSIAYSGGGRVTTTTVYGDSSAPTATTTRTEHLTGLPPGTSSNVTVASPNGTTTATTAIDAGNKLVTTTTNVPGATNSAVQVTYNGLLVSVTTPAVHSLVLFTYDALGRLSTSSDPGTGAVTTTGYDATTGQVASEVTANGALSTSTVNTYYGASETSPGQLKTQTVNGMAVVYTYDSQNRVTGVSGNTYPLFYAYDGYGALQTLTTTGAAGNATTTWVYDPATGLLTQKLDAASKGPNYTYWPSGRVKTRTWARGAKTSYFYDKGGTLKGLSYNDGTPNVAITNNRLGKPGTVTDAAGSHTLTYTRDGQLKGDSIAGGNGLLAGISVNVGYDDGFLRRTSLGASGGSLSYSAGYGYDPATGNLSTITQGSTEVTYGYQANSTRLGSSTFKSNGTVRLYTERTPDGLGRLQTISNRANVAATSTSFSAHTYSYNAQGQRYQATLADNSYWSYGYNGRGEVTSGKHYWNNGHAIAGQQFDYDYDAIGNRVSTTTNGRGATYTPNLLNQYEQRQVPGAVDVIGTVDPSATLTINGQGPTTRNGNYFTSTIGVANTNGPVAQPVDVLASKTATSAGQPDTVSEVPGKIFVPQTPEVFHYDDDGNLTQDGHWTYTWDAENRLIRMDSNVPAYENSVEHLWFAYDWQCRRISKSVLINYPPSFAPVVPTRTRFVYDGWNLVAELNDGGSPLRTYLWGQDLSGSLQGAGGVGGLLSLNDYTNGAQTHFATYDGNGNVMGLVQASDGSVSAQYAYNAFGKLLQATGGSIALTNFIRWSSKYADLDTDLIYYGYRYFDPSCGRWLSRDPLGESSDINVCTYLSNRAIGNADLLGLQDISGDISRGLPPGTTPTQALQQLNNFANVFGRLPTQTQYDIIVQKGGLTDPIQLTMLALYMGLKPAQSPFKLTADQVKHLGVNLNVKTSEQFIRDLKQNFPTKAPFKIKYDILAVATMPATLGRFYAVVDADVTCAGDSWKVVGTFTVKDTYDFDYNQDAALAALSDLLHGVPYNDTTHLYEGRTMRGEVNTVLMSRVRGTPYAVTSEKVHFSQRHDQNAADIGE